MQYTFSKDSLASGLLMGVLVADAATAYTLCYKTNENKRKREREKNYEGEEKPYEKIRIFKLNPGNILGDDSS